MAILSKLSIIATHVAQSSLETYNESVFLETQDEVLKSVAALQMTTKTANKNKNKNNNNQIFSVNDESSTASTPSPTFKNSSPTSIISSGSNTSDNDGSNNNPSGFQRANNGALALIAHKANKAEEFRAEVQKDYSGVVTRIIDSEVHEMLAILSRENVLDYMPQSFELVWQDVKKLSGCKVDAMKKALRGASQHNTLSVSDIVFSMSLAAGRVYAKKDEVIAWLADKGDNSKKITKPQRDALIKFLKGVTPNKTYVMYYELPATSQVDDYLRYFNLMGKDESVNVKEKLSVWKTFYDGAKKNENDFPSDLWFEQSYGKTGVMTRFWKEPKVEAKVGWKEWVVSFLWIVLGGDFLGHANFLVGGDFLDSTKIEEREIRHGMKEHNRLVAALQSFSISMTMVHLPFSYKSFGAWLEQGSIELFGILLGKKELSKQEILESPSHVAIATILPHSFLWAIAMVLSSMIISYQGWSSYQSIKGSKLLWFISLFLRTLIMCTVFAGFPDLPYELLLESCKETWPVATDPTSELKRDTNDYNRLQCNLQTHGWILTAIYMGLFAFLPVLVVGCVEVCRRIAGKKKISEDDSHPCDCTDEDLKTGSTISTTN